MASMCPRCHQELEEDAICCAELRHTWKCAQCGKRSTGFVMPRGRCFLCGGENKVVQPYHAGNPQAARTVEEAMQFEVDMYQFYRLGRRRARELPEGLSREICRELAAEEEHVAILQTELENFNALCGSE